VEHSGRTWVLLDRVRSTSDYLREEIEAGRLGEAVVLARGQTAGRGRHGRTWLSPGGGLYLTVSVPAIPDVQPVLHAVAGGLAVVDCLRDELGIDAGLKWPNDVLVRDRKICGLLAEMLPRGVQTFVLLGLGVNVAAVSPDQSLEYEPTSIAEELDGQPGPTPEALARRIVERLDRKLAGLAEQGGEALLQRWRARASTLGRRVRVRLPRGELIGEAVDIRDDFALLVATDSGIEAVEVGDCLHLERP